MGCQGEARREGGKWICQAEKCPHRRPNGGCGLGKVSLSCDNNDCQWNVELAPGIYGCKAMDVHLDARGLCESARGPQEGNDGH